MKIKKIILNVFFALLILSTCICTLAEYIGLQKEMEHFHGSGVDSLGPGLDMGFLFMLFVFFITAEASIYFNLRYFLLCKRKTILKTIFNIVLIIIPIIAYISLMHFQYPELTRPAERLFFLLCPLLVVLRIINCFIPYAREILI